MLEIELRSQVNINAIGWPWHEHILTDCPKSWYTLHSQSANGFRSSFNMIHLHKSLIFMALISASMSMSVSNSDFQICNLLTGKCGVDLIEREPSLDINPVELRSYNHTQYVLQDEHHPLRKVGDIQKLVSMENPLALCECRVYQDFGQSVNICSCQGQPIAFILTWERNSISNIYFN